MSTVKANNAQIGQSATANQNFTLYQPASPDGTVRLGVGNSGATTADALTVDNAGNCTHLGNLTVSGTGTSTFAGTLNATTALQSGGVAASRIVQGTAQTTNGASSYGYTGIPSWVKRITLQFYGTGATNGVYVQIGSGAYVTTGYSIMYHTLTGAATGSSTSTPTTYMVGFSVSGFQNPGGSAFSGAIVLSTLGSNQWVADMSTYNTVSGSSVLAKTVGSIALSGALDRIQITTISGTFSAGSVNIIYEG